MKIAEEREKLIRYDPPEAKEISRLLDEIKQLQTENKRLKEARIGNPLCLKVDDVITVKSVERGEPSKP